jgi:hypothetical protein
MAHIVLKAPLFHGKKEAEAKLGSTAEDFISQVDNLQATSPWTDVEAAGHAISYLNGSARFWWAESLRMVDPAAKAAAARSYVAFKTLFKEWFFSVKNTHDLSVDWAGLKQRGNESVVSFALRVAGALGQYHELFPLPPRPVDTPTLEPGLDAMVTAAGDQAAAVAHRRQAVRTAAKDMHQAGAALGIKAMAEDMVMKLIAEGVRDPKQRELVRRQHKLELPLRTLIPMMRDLEEVSAKKEATAIPIPKLMPINLGATEAADPHQQLSAEEIDVINNLRRGKPGPGARGGGAAGRGGRGGGRGGRGGPRGGGGDPPEPPRPPPAGRMDDATYYAKLCTYCSKNGHLKEVCFRKASDEKKAAAAAGGSSTGNVSSMQQQQQGSLNAPGWM